MILRYELWDCKEDKLVLHCEYSDFYGLLEFLGNILQSDFFDDFMSLNEIRDDKDEKTIAQGMEIIKWAKILKSKII